MGLRRKPRRDEGAFAQADCGEPIASSIRSHAVLLSRTYAQPSRCGILSQGRRCTVPVRWIGSGWIPVGDNIFDGPSMQHSNKNNLTVICDACGSRHSWDVDWLHDMSHLPCPGCGNQIDLRKEPWKGEIQRLWNAAHDRGPPRRRLP